MIKVLVVDDLFLMRSLISDLLESDPEIRVIASAKDGKEALEKILRLKPDVVTLDLSMPGMDGLTALHEIMDRCPTPVVILSAHESRVEADIVLKCLNAGAISFVFKPSQELSLDIDKVKLQLLREVKAVVTCDMRQVKSVMSRKKHDAQRPTHDAQRVVVIGASTGGPQTLEAVLSVLPRVLSAAVIVVQHVPGMFFSQSLAKRLSSHCHLDVKVAEDGETIHAAEVYLIPFGFAPSFKRDGELFILHLKPAHTDNAPSIDDTMSSLSGIYRENVLGIILTGIGNDGVAGMKAIKQHGGQTIAQDNSALINGMPKAVIEAGFADEVLSLEKISEAIMKFVEK